MSLDGNQIAALGQALAQARKAGSIAAIPLEAIDSDEGAEAVLAEAVEAMGEPQRGYATLRLRTSVDRARHVETLIHAPLMGGGIGDPDAPFHVPHGLLGARWGVLFTIGRPYPGHEEISPRTALDAILRCQLTIDLVGRRVPGSAPLNVRTATADFALHVATFQGPTVTLDAATLWTDTPIVFRIDGHAVAAGPAGAFFRDAVDTLAGLADQLAGRDSLLNTGDRVSIGARLPALQVLPGQELQAYFGDLGSVTARLA